MPTPTGLPKVGEVWQLLIPVARDPQPIRFVVLERSRGDDWSLRAYTANGRRHLYVNCAYSLTQGWLTYVADAGPKTRAKLGIG